MSAFGVFFSQSPSFLDYQSRLQMKNGQSNAQSILGMHKLPSVSQVRNLLDNVPPEALYPLLVEITDGLYNNSYLSDYHAINDTLLMAIDGTNFFTSQKISCPCCTQQTLKEGQTLYRHSAVTPVIVTPEQSNVIPLPPEFVQPQDGQDKQDCELAAAKRWLNTWGNHYCPWNMTILGDDLDCHQPFCHA